VLHTEIGNDPSSRVLVYLDLALHRFAIPTTDVEAQTSGIECGANSDIGGRVERRYKRPGVNRGAVPDEIATQIAKLTSLIGACMYESTGRKST
jgi:hypothetical protein